MTFPALFVIVFVPLGAMLSSLMGACIGRRLLMLIATFLMAILWIMMRFTEYPWFNLIYLFLGLATGLSEPIALTFVGELTEPQFRSLMTAAVPVSTMLGKLLEETLGIIVGSSTIICINAAVCFVAFLAMLFVPESPQWLTCKSTPCGFSVNAVLTRNFSLVCRARSGHGGGKSPTLVQRMARGDRSYCTT